MLSTNIIAYRQVCAFNRHLTASEKIVNSTPMSNPFTYQSLKDDKLQIFWHGKPVMLLKGKAALQLMGKLQGADEQETQLILAKVTGNFKRGNERQAPKGQ